MPGGLTVPASLISTLIELQNDIDIGISEPFGFATCTKPYAFASVSNFSVHHNIIEYLTSPLIFFGLVSLNQSSFVKR